MNEEEAKSQFDVEALDGPAACIAKYAGFIDEGKLDIKRFSPSEHTALVLAKMMEKRNGGRR